jgi:hypothetical protein
MRILAGILATVALVAVAPVRAHDQFRLVGTLVATELAKNRVAMRFKEFDGTEETVWLKLASDTVITRDKKRVPKTELKAGLSVVDDAEGDDYDSLDAIEIRIVPAPKK